MGEPTRPGPGSGSGSGSGSPHPSPEQIAGVVLDERDATHPEGDVREHLSGCARCRTLADELGGLAHAARPDDPPSAIAWETPPASVWERISREVEAGAPTGGRRPTAALPGHDPSHEIHLADDDHRLERDDLDGRDGSGGGGRGSRPSSRRTNRRRGMPWVAAGVAVVAAGAVGAAIGQRGIGGDEADTPDVPPSSSAAGPPGNRVELSAQLDDVDSGAPRGEAWLVSDDREVDLHVEPADLPRGAGYLEVWLINTDGERLVSVGVLDGSGAQDFRVPPEVVDRGYTLVDISREPLDGDATHSGSSLAQGRLA